MVRKYIHENSVDVSHFVYFRRRSNSVQYKCSECGTSVCRGSSMCQVCYRKRMSQNQSGIPLLRSRKVKRPPLDEVKVFVRDNGYSAAGRKYGVSDNAIRKWLKSGIQ